GVVDGGEHRIGARVQRFADHISGTVRRVGVVTGATAHGVVAGTSAERRGAGTTCQNVHATVAGDDIGEGVARAVNIGRAGQLQIFYIGSKGVVDGREHLVGARVQRFADHISGTVRRVRVVTNATAHGVVTGT